MKSNLVRSSILVLGAALSCSAVFAQGLNPLRADVPFAFSVSGATLPAGSYVISLDIPNTLVVRNAHGGPSAATQASASESVSPRNTTPKLVFHRIGDRYFLAEVWTDGNYGRHVRASAQERNLAKGLNGPDAVIVAAR